MLGMQCQWCVMYVFLFLEFYNFFYNLDKITRFLKDLKDTFQKSNSIVLIFIYIATLYKAWKKSQSSFSHSFLAVFPC